MPPTGKKPSAGKKQTVDETSLLFHIQARI